MKTCLKKIMKENFPILEKKLDFKVQEAQRVPKKLDPRRNIPRPLNLYISYVGTFKVVPEVHKALLIFFEFLFLHSVLVESLFLPSVPNL